MATFLSVSPWTQEHEEDCMQETRQLIGAPAGIRTPNQQIMSLDEVFLKINGSIQYLWRAVH